METGGLQDCIMDQYLLPRSQLPMTIGEGSCCQHVYYDSHHPYDNSG